MSAKCLVLLLIIALFLMGCARTPVAVSCPPSPRLEESIKQVAEETRASSASAGMNLTRSFSELWESFSRELRRSFSAATAPSSGSLPASSGPTDKTD